jgi:hypothetical protein
MIASAGIDAQLMHLLELTQKTSTPDSFNRWLSVLPVSVWWQAQN